jgi:hypothetical protein
VAGAGSAKAVVWRAAAGRSGTEGRGQREAVAEPRRRGSSEPWCGRTLWHRRRGTAGLARDGARDTGGLRLWGTVGGDGVRVAAMVVAAAAGALHRRRCSHPRHATMADGSCARPWQLTAEEKESGRAQDAAGQAVCEQSHGGAVGRGHDGDAALTEGACSGQPWRELTPGLARARTRPDSGRGHRGGKGKAVRRPGRSGAEGRKKERRRCFMGPSAQGRAPWCCCGREWGKTRGRAGDKSGTARPHHRRDVTAETDCTAQRGQASNRDT